MAKFEVGKPEEVGHYQSARQQRALPKPRMQPPLTPMIDVTFQLLLFFLLTTEFRVAEGNIPGTLPQAPSAATATPEEVPLDPVKILVRPAGELLQQAVFEIEGAAFQLASPEKLYEQLVSRRKQAGGSKEIPVVIHPRYDVRWDFVVEAFNQAVRAEYKNITFAHGGA